MALPNAQDLANDPSAHGQRPFGYVIEVVNEPPPTLIPSFWSQSVQWSQIHGKLDTVEMGYGSQPFSATFRMANLATNEVRGSDYVRPSGFNRPKNGQVIRVWHTDQTVQGFPSVGRYIFQGVVVNVNEENGSQGSYYNVQAVSNITRLNETHVTFSTNLMNDPINPSPKFDANGQVLSRLKTVREIIQDVMAFRDAWNTAPYFDYDDIDWNGLDTDPRCGGFVPPNIQFMNTRKGDAIEQVLQAAGNFTFCYVILPDGREKIRIVELNLNCNRCGEKWDIEFIDPNVVGGRYAHELQIERDSTEWSSRESANTCRVTLAPIRFYSGHFIIPERYEDPLETPLSGDPLSRNCITVDQDTDLAQKERSYNPDRTFYRFTSPGGVVHDMRSVKQYYVGMPMFPSWNPHEDWLPDLLEITSVKLPNGVTSVNGMTEDQLVPTHEWQMYTVGYSIARGSFDRQHMNNLRVYEAWHAPDQCIACAGTGLVKKVYDNEDNEPEFKYFAAFPSGQQPLTSPAAPSGARLIVRVSNYIYDPANFGTSIHPSGLEPLNVGVVGDDPISDYPLPWKHLCPCCRGVGRRPLNRIRNIQGVLFQGRSNATTEPNVSGGVGASGIMGGEIYLDPDRVQSGPETWQESVSRIAISEPPIVQVEQHISSNAIVMPRFEHANKSWRMIKRLPPADQRYRFKHPLQFKNLKRMSADPNAPAGDPSTKIVPDSWGSYVPYTTIAPAAPEHDIDYQMGTVRFREPLFIACRQEYAAYQKATRDRYVLDVNGKLVSSTPGRGQTTSDIRGYPTGYWRPARVWMQCFYTRENFYDYMNVDRFNQPINYATFNAVDPEGVEQTYAVRASIHDGCLAMEVIKKIPEPTEVGGTEFPTGNRVMQVCINEQSMEVEVYADDLYKMPVPPTADRDYAVVEKIKRDANLLFPRGRMFIYSRTTPGERQLEMEGYENLGFRNSDMRPRIYSVSMNDQRPAALARAVRTLEASNDLSVQGQMLLNNFTIDFSHGLGWVDHPRGRASVMRVSLRYGGGFKATLDLGRERARAGETLPKDTERMNNFEKTLSKFIRSARTTQAAERRKGSRFSDDPNAGVNGRNSPME